MEDKVLSGEHIYSVYEVWLDWRRYRGSDSAAGSGSALNDTECIYSAEPIHRNVFSTIESGHDFQIVSECFIALTPVQLGY